MSYLLGTKSGYYIVIQGGDMSGIQRTGYLTPRDVPENTASNILTSLNAAISPQELASTLRFSGTNSVGRKLAYNIWKSRNQLGDFRDMNQIFAIPQIGRKRFAQIVDALSGGDNDKKKGNSSVPGIFNSTDG